MIWNKYTIKTTTKDADMVSALLMDYGIFDIQIENNVQLTDEELNQMYADFVKELPEDDGTCYINFFEEFDESETPENRKARIETIWAGLRESEEIFGLDHMEFSGDTLDSQDWENKWKEYFKPFLVDDILIKPTWEEIPKDLIQSGRTSYGITGQEELQVSIDGTCDIAAESVATKTYNDFSIVIDIDPGMAFGTGMHETTRLCLRGIRKFMKPGDRFVDFGCGSGILSIGALKLGASEAEAVDIDPQAVIVAEENFEVNNIPADSYSLYTGNILKDDELKKHFAEAPAHVIAANILADVIEPLAGVVQDYLLPGGVFISSGIIDNKEQLIVDAVNANPELELIEVNADGDWRSVIARRKL